jgi:hypothetical protein
MQKRRNCEVARTALEKAMSMSDAKCSSPLAPRAVRQPDMVKLQRECMSVYRRCQPRRQTHGSLAAMT